MKIIPPENHPVIIAVIAAVMIVGLVAAGRQAEEVQQLVAAFAAVLALYVVGKGGRRA